MFAFFRRGALKRRIAADLGGEPWSITESRAPRCGHAVWFAYYDEGPMNVYWHRAYLVSPRADSAFKVPLVTHVNSAVWSADGRYAAFPAHDREDGLISVWDTETGLTAVITRPAIYWCDIQFPEAARLRSTLDSARTPPEWCPRVVEVDLRHAPWQRPAEISF
jgi:hypothetical protein